MSGKPEIFYDARIDLTDEAFWCTMYVYKINKKNSFLIFEILFLYVFFQIHAQTFEANNYLY